MTAASRYSGDVREAGRFWQEGERPRICVWELTLKCDLACRHCGSRAGAARPDELSTAEALDVVDQLARFGIREVILIGGEAYLRDDWVEIAQAITTSGMTPTMVTGGYGLDSLRVLDAVTAGIAIVGISLDGIALTHDHLRGRVGSFEAAVSAAARVVQSGAALSINSQVNGLTLPELPRIARLVASLGATAWQLQLTVALGRAADRPDLLLQPHQMLALMPLLQRLKDEVLEPAGVQLFLGNNIGYFGPYEKTLRYGGGKGVSWSGCLAGRAALGLEADGTLKGCPSLPTKTHAAGSVRDTPIIDLWQTSHRMRSLARRTTADLWGFCAGCDHAARCLGGCTWTAEALFGRSGNNPYCHHRALALARRGQRERVVQVEPAPGDPFDHGRFDLVLEPLVGDEANDPSALAAVLDDGGTTGIWSRTGLTALTRKSALERSEIRP